MKHSVAIVKTLSLWLYFKSVACGSRLPPLISLWKNQMALNNVDTTIFAVVKLVH